MALKIYVKMHIFLFNLLCLLLAGSGVASAAPKSLPNFESSYVAHPSSLSQSFSFYDLGQFLQKLNAQVVEGVDGPVELLRPNMTLQQLFDLFIKRNQQLSRDLLNLEELVNEDPLVNVRNRKVLSQLLRAGASLVNFSERRQARFRREYFSDPLKVDIVSRRFGLSGQDVYDPKNEAHQEFLRDLRSRPLGVLGEIRAAIRVPQLVHANITIRDLIKKIDGYSKVGGTLQVLRNLKVEFQSDELVERALNREIDLIFLEGNTLVWAEVKSTLTPVEKGDHTFKKIVEQVEVQKKISRALRLKTFFQIFLINGVTDSAHAALTSIGARVIGSRVASEGQSLMEDSIDSQCLRALLPGLVGGNGTRAGQ